MAKRLYRVPAQLTTDPNVLPDARTMAAIAKAATTAPERYAAIVRAQITESGAEPDEHEEYTLLREIAKRKASLSDEQARLRTLFERLDNLYFPETIQEQGGADHWPEGAKPGRAHISDNVYPVYVDIPAALQAVEPIENYVADSSEDEDREAAARVERLYFGWKDEDEFEAKLHRACVVKALYGISYVKVYWDRIEERPTISIIDAPENLYVGWGSSQYDRMDWALYCYGLTKEAVEEDYGLKVGSYESEGVRYPVVTGDHADPIYTIRPELQRERNAPTLELVEVYDYWYKKPKGAGRRPEIWNCIYVGNRMVKNSHHPEYTDLPYVPIPNTYIPKSPYGRPELYDIEQMIREKDERLTAGAQMISSIVDGQMWQVVGPDAPNEVPANLTPKPNKVVAPGPGAEIKALQPFVPQFALEEYLKRLDLEIETISGLNDMLIGRAPAHVLGSSKAIAALVANYEARISMKRSILYSARKRIWKMAAQVWERKSREVRDIIDGRYRLEVKPPELTPRDELEIAQMAINLVSNRIWSSERAMDRTGVEDPSDEKKLIRSEQTDPAMNPAAVQAQAALLATLQQLQAAGVQTDQLLSQDQTANTSRTLNRPASGTQSLNGPENAGQAPPEAAPANAAPGASPILAQTMVQGGKGSGRIISQSQIGGEG